VATAEQRSCRHLCSNLSFVGLLVRFRRDWLVRAASGSSGLLDTAHRACFDQRPPSASRQARV